MMMKGPIREIIPVGEQLVSVALPDSALGASVRLLVSEAAPITRVVDGRIEIVVTGIAVSEVVLIDFDCRPEC